MGYTHPPRPERPDTSITNKELFSRPKKYRQDVPPPEIMSKILWIVLIVSFIVWLILI